jgi:hypothetical protein
MDDLRKKVEDLERKINLLNNASTIPLAWDQAIRSRFSNLGHTTITQILDFPNAGAGGNSSVVVSFPGVVAGDAIVVTPPSDAIIGNLGSLFIPYVTAPGQITIKFVNPDAGSALNPGSGLFNITVFKK